MKSNDTSVTRKSPGRKKKTELSVLPRMPGKLEVALDNLQAVEVALYGQIGFAQIALDALSGVLDEYRPDRSFARKHRGEL
ncbi:hypothetical protein [uncultured Paludibaculum sp.]|uniref:hypothetical protein n=1 Tax=uncultured Paludibaculum sp. TaxID=1765020 RepID=UPI002AAA8806|nr:hypothetical protein [uncultured Paludibaculum sp.]